jgi:hypothetical protein
MFAMTLRKAAKVRSKIEERIAELTEELNQTHVTVNLNDNTSISDVIGAARAEYTRKYTLLSVLLDVQVQIRNQIATANVNAGVSQRLASIAALESRLKVFSPKEDVLSYADSGRRRPRRKRRNVVSNDALTMEQIVARYQAAKAKLQNSENSYNIQETQTFSFVSPEMAESFNEEVASLKRVIEDLHEQNEAANASTKISLTDATMAILQQHDLI